MGSIFILIPHPLPRKYKKSFKPHGRGQVSNNLAPDDFAYDKKYGKATERNNPNGH